MDQFKIFTQASPWFILLCLLAGAIYAFLLYRKESSWSASLNKVLAGLRFILVFLICFLLIGPLIKQLRNLIEKPIIVFAIDNSESIALTEDSTKLKKVLSTLQTTAQQLEEEGLSVEVQSLNNQNNLDEVRFNNSSTDLSSLLNSIQTNYENRNIGSVVLVSDGIYNKGASPAYRPHNFLINTIALGDTTPKQDINLKALYFNKVAYLGNKFPIVAEIQNTGYKGRALVVSLKQNNKLLEKKTVNLKNYEDLQQVTFHATANNKGRQHLTIETQSLDNEFTLKNNIRHAYIDVIDGKEKILLVASTPHPDIKAIKSALDKQDNYELVIHIPGFNQFKEDKYDLIIFHQIPDQQNVANAILNNFLNKKTAIWYIIGNQTNLSLYNNINNAVKIDSKGNQKDEVTPIYNSNFDRFQYDQELTSIISKLPPISVPFGNYSLANGAEVLLYQKVGTLTTEKPLLAIQSTGERKTAVLVGEGLWEWRLREFELTQKHEAVDQLITKLTQLLSAKEDKRKFKVYPIVSEIYESEKAVFEAEVYNEIFEKIYNQKINLSITDEEGKVRNYSFVNTEANSRFEVSGLDQGVYKFTANTQLNGKTEKSEGEFTVQKLDLEALNTTADHQVLRQLSEQNGGRLFKTGELDQLTSYLKQNRAKDIIRSNEEILEVIHLKWVFFLLLFLISTEWVIRKYKGSY